MSQVESQAPAYFAYISKDFIGRREEIRLFVEKILAPETPACNIFAISGGAGVGKTTLLNQFIKVAQSPDFKDDCLTALVNERWLTPMDVMRQFADQLSRAGFHLKKFEDEWKKYRDITQQQQAKQEEQQREIIDTVSKTLGSVASSATDAIATRYGMPGVGSVVGPITGDGAKVALTFMTKKYEEHQYAKEIEMSQEPHVPLTVAFVADLNAVAQPHFALLYEQDKLQRVILFLDAFGRLAPTIVPWLLDYLLPRLECNVGLVIAGRKSIEDVTPDGYSRWQRYQDNGTLYTTSLGNFSPEETKAYLNARGITDDDKIQSYRQVSQGLPYYLYLLTAQGTEGDIDPGASVVENVLRRIPREEKIKRRLAWQAALLTKPFNQDDLEALPLFKGQDMFDLYDWLLAQPFVKHQGGPHYDEHIQALFCLYLRHRSPNEYNNVRKALVEHYEEQLQNRVGLENYSSNDWLPLVLALVSQLLLLQAPNDVYYCGAIGYVIRAYANVRRTEEIIKVLRDLAQDQDNALTDTKARIIAKNLLICLQADLTSREFINANSYLLERAAREPSFPKEVLAVIYRMRGQAYTALHEYRQAIQDLNQAIALYDKDAFEYICRGIAYRLLGDYQHAIEDFGTALTKNPNSTQVYAERGLAYRHISQYAEALADFNSAITFNSKSSWVYGQRGKVHRLLKNYSQAVEDFNNAISLDAQDAWAYAQRGLAFLWMKDLAQAKSDYVHSQEIDTKNISYSWVSTWIEMCLQRDDVEAIKQLETLAAADQPDYLTLVCQGVALWLQSNFDKALVTLGQAVLLEPHRWDVHFWKGMTLASLEKDEEAIHEVKQALELGLPPVLLAPLKWFEQSRPAFYQTCIPLLLEHQGVN